MAAIMRAAVATLLASVAAASCAEGTCGARPTLGTDQLLIQTAEVKMRARAAQRPPVQMMMIQADGQIARMMQKRNADPAQVAMAIQKGLAAVMEAVRHFMAQPPEVEMGLNVLGARLLEVVKEPVEQHYNDPTAYAAFEEGWMSFFDTAATVAPSVQGNITLFTEDGSPDAIIMAVSDILTILTEGVVEFVPQETAQEVVKYVDAVADVLGALGTSWAGFESGQEAQAIEDLYFGLRAALDQVLPEDLQNDETYKLIIGTLDGIMYNLSETVQEFQRQIVEGAVCWKVQKARARKRPSVCPEGFYWNGEQLCLPEPTGQQASLLQDTGKLERATARKTRSVDSATGGKQAIPNGARVALCDESGNHSEKIGHWCFATCPTGMMPAGTQCKTECGGEFPADDGAALCGHNAGVITQAILNMVLGAMNGAISSGLLIAAMAKDGVDSDSLVKTIEAFVHMGKPFAYKQCPLQGESHEDE
jgi:hypothetical protein